MNRTALSCQMTDLPTYLLISSPQAPINNLNALSYDFFIFFLFYSFKPNIRKSASYQQSGHHRSSSPVYLRLLQNDLPSIRLLRGAPPSPITR